MENLDKYLKKAKTVSVVREGRFEKFNLKENPFPSSPFVNPDSNDARTNGDIYEPSIREKEYQKMQENFLEVSQSDPNHLRLGYIEDTSYVGRGNGKSAFILNMQKRINQDFGLNVSNQLNKSFAVTVVPEPSGKTKTFERFVDLLANSIFRSGIIEDVLTSLRLEAILNLHETFDIQQHFSDEEDLVRELNSADWFSEAGIDLRQVSQQVLQNENLQSLPNDFPLYSPTATFFPTIVKQSDFIEYYKNLKRGKPKYEFIFSQLVDLFLAAGFNGAYVFIDDFERIPDFQSERQKRDFAVEIRSCLFDGLYTSAKIGFYNFVLVLHAGIPRLIQNAWDQSGLGHRSPIFYKAGTPKHVIRFEKITLEHAFALLRKYLKAYRINNEGADDISPFTETAVSKIAEVSEFNASKILKMAYEALERAADKAVSEIDVDLIAQEEASDITEEKQTGGIHDAPTKNLMQEAE